MFPPEENYTNIYINNLDYSIGEDELKKICEDATGVGSVDSVIVFKAHNKNSSAYGFCNFNSHNSAKRAIEKLNNNVIKGRKISASRAIKKDDRCLYKHQLYEMTPDNNVNVYVKNFERDLDEEKLRVAFEPFGNITSIRIIRDPKGNSKGYGFVSYSNHEEAELAIEKMNGTKLIEREISVTFYTPKSTEPSPVGSTQTSPTMSPVQEKVAVETQFSINSLPFIRKVQMKEEEEEKPSMVDKGYDVLLRNLKFVTDEKEVAQFFYDFKLLKVAQVPNHRKIFTGDWLVSFSSERDMHRALDICKYLTVRSRPVYAEPYLSREMSQFS